MKSTMILFSMLLLFVLPALAQDMQYVSSQSGDTLFVKDDYEYGAANTLYLLMQSDSLAPAGRVYYLKASGIYSFINNPQSSKNYKTTIMGPEQNLKTGSSPVVYPPVCSGFYDGTTKTAGGMTSNKDLLVKNIDLEMGSSAGNGQPGAGWAYFGFGGPNMRLQVDNCIVEHTWWCWVGGPPLNETTILTNNYFVNLSGHTCRRNGGVTDFNNTKTQDTLIVQNNTHVNIQGTLYKFRDGYFTNKAIFNHNNYVDCAGYVIMNNGNTTNLSITNNIYVNCQLQDMSSVLVSADAGEVDAWGEPMGLVNLRVDSTFTANIGNHGVYVDKNLAYWDPSLANIDSILIANNVDNRTDWTSQRRTMNTRTDSLFQGLYGAYPKLVNQGWITDRLPAFVNTDVLFDTRLATLKAYAIACVDTAFGSPLTSYRTPANPEATYYIFADYPLPINLAYTDADLLTAAVTSSPSIQLPIGDLGWFPAEYATWKAQEGDELAYIQMIVDNGNSVPTTGELPEKFQLHQNYPNPFNPGTEISYTIGKAGNVTLKVYNILGQHVATLVDGFQAANTYKVNFNASNLASGIYLYELRSGSNVITKKMVLMK